MDEEQNNRVDYLKEQSVFEENANLLIIEMLVLDNQTNEDTSMLVDEMLHAIFFLGIITFPGSFSPERVFVGDNESLEDLKELYPQAFTLYSSQLPRRSPFSCVLDMVVKLYGEESEEEIKNQLRELCTRMKDNDNTKILKSTVICISQVSNSKKYYGVSMSTHRKPSRQIIIAASCLNFWHEYVAEAVLSFYPQTVRKHYFDGTIILPENIRVEAFNINEQRRMDPCLACKDLFALNTTEIKKKSPYGNCAEPASLSKLFKNEDVNNQVQRFTNQNVNDRMRAERDVSKHLDNVLKQLAKENSVFRWDNRYYTPQSATV